ncbi:hypothetical protein [Methylobacterium nigriterrae]|uniref:hypothetical protein n=1 Tax=Methylobacterium nigriterrae TaxID=3127512 RepID=UPI0030138CA0
MKPHLFEHGGISFRIDFHGNELGWEGRLFIEGHPTLQVVRVLNMTGTSEDEARRTIVKGCEALAADTPWSDVTKS